MMDQSHQVLWICTEAQSIGFSLLVHYITMAKRKELTLTSRV